MSINKVTSTNYCRNSIHNSIYIKQVFDLFNTLIWNLFFSFFLLFLFVKWFDYFLYDFSNYDVDLNCLYEIFSRLRNSHYIITSCIYLFWYVRFSLWISNLHKYNWISFSYNNHRSYYYTKHRSSFYFKYESFAYRITFIYTFILVLCLCLKYL